MDLGGKEFEGDEGAVVRRETGPKREKQERLMRQYKKSKTLSASSTLYAPDAEVSIPHGSFKCRPGTMCLCLEVINRTISGANDLWLIDGSLRASIRPTFVCFPASGAASLRNSRNDIPPPTTTLRQHQCRYHSETVGLEVISINLLDTLLALTILLVADHQPTRMG
jgi:hypothetical protein